MSKILKDLIDRAENEEKTVAHFVSKIESLQMKVAELKTKLEVQKESSKQKYSKHKKGKHESGEMILLKEQVSSQKQELAQTQQKHDVLKQSHNFLAKDYERLDNLNKTLEEGISKIDNKNKLLLEKTKKSERDLTNINKTVNDLEKEKKMLEEINSTFQISVEELEKTIEGLMSDNLELKRENQKLSKITDTVKAENSRLAKFEENVSYLENKVDGLRKENEELKQKEAILLANTINTMETRKREPTIIAENLVSKESLLKERGDVKIEEPLEVVDTIEPVKINLENEMLQEEALTRKKVCPNCGNNKKDFIREIDDKTKLLYTYPKIYAKIYRCGECGNEWR
jgi:DNA repair exonuclease SbcCD ATPase subunit